MSDTALISSGSSFSIAETELGSLNFSDLVFFLCESSGTETFWGDFISEAKFFTSFFFNKISVVWSSGLGMICVETNSPTLEAAIAPASTADFTAAVSPTIIIVIKPASALSLPINVTLAAFNIASAASIEATKPRVSTIPRARSDIN